MQVRMSYRWYDIWHRLALRGLSEPRPCHRSCEWRCSSQQRLDERKPPAYKVEQPSGRVALRDQLRTFTLGRFPARWLRT